MNNRFLLGLKGGNYKGNTPKFVEPVCLDSGGVIGDDVILGPNLIIGKNCEIGHYSQLKNTILFDNVELGNYCKLNWCIIDENVRIDDCFDATHSFITKNEKDELITINFEHSR